jgi:hypothetical protein
LPDKPFEHREICVVKNLDLIIENYIAEQTDDVSALLQELLKETEAITGRSRWSIGQVEGKLMQFLVKVSGTRNAVEIGTFTGFSALMIARRYPLTACWSPVNPVKNMLTSRGAILKKARMAGKSGWN